jgi:hypothetical protein
MMHARRLTTTVLGVLVGALGFAAAPALAAAPETPGIAKASAITATTATLNGVLNPGTVGELGSYEFFYRESPSECRGEGEAVTPTTSATGAKQEPAKANVTALQPNAQYTFCLLARNEAGETSALSGPETLTTSPAPPEVIAESEHATNIKSSEASLEAEVNPNNETTTYTFEYATTDAALGTVGATKIPGAGPLVGFGEQTAGVTVGSLAPSTPYFYRVVATNAKAEKTEGTVAHFTTHPPLPVATTEGATEISYDTATLTGEVVPDSAMPVSDARWCFQYGTVESGEYNLGSQPMIPGDAGQGTTPVAVSVKLTGLEPGATYRYRLVAVNSIGAGLGSIACGTEGGQQADGAEATFTTPGTLPPPQAATGSASSVAQNTATISGTIDPRGTRTSYEFQLGLDTSYGAQVYGDAGEGNEPETFSLPLAALQPETTYHYRVVAISQSGTIYGADEIFTTAGYPTESLVPPGSAPLIPKPVFAFPAEVKQTKIATTKVKKKAKKKARNKKRAKGRKAAAYSHVGNRRNGR